MANSRGVNGEHALLPQPEPNPAQRVPFQQQVGTGRHSAQSAARKNGDRARVPVSRRRANVQGQSGWRRFGQTRGNTVRHRRIRRVWTSGHSSRCRRRLGRQPGLAAFSRRAASSGKRSNSLRSRAARPRLRPRAGRIEADGSALAAREQRRYFRPPARPAAAPSAASIATAIATAVPASTAPAGIHEPAADRRVRRRQQPPGVAYGWRRQWSVNGQASRATSAPRAIGAQLQRSPLLGPAPVGAQL